MSLADDSAKRYSLIELSRRPMARTFEVQADEYCVFTNDSVFAICDNCNRHEDDKCLCGDIGVPIPSRMINVAHIEYKKGIMPSDYSITRYSLIELGPWEPSDVALKDVPLRVSDLELHRSHGRFEFCSGCLRPEGDDCVCNDRINRSTWTYAHVNWYGLDGKLIAPPEHISEKSRNE